MRTAVLFSGGKDSNLALHYAMKHTEVQCLIVMLSNNPESYMFHTPNIKWTTHQAAAIGLPVIVQTTKGEKEHELKDLVKAIKIAIKRYKVQGIITGAVESVYQASRIQKITNELKIECFNPLWQKDQVELLEELLKLKYEIIIVGTFAEGLQGYAGKMINKTFIKDMIHLQKKYGINPAGEGGEYESFVLNAPHFKNPLTIKKSHQEKDAHGGEIFYIDEL